MDGVGRLLDLLVHLVVAGIRRTHNPLRQRISSRISDYGQVVPVGKGFIRKPPKGRRLSPALHAGLSTCSHRSESDLQDRRRCRTGLNCRPLPYQGSLGWQTFKGLVAIKRVFHALWNVAKVPVHKNSQSTLRLLALPVARNLRPFRPDTLQKRTDTRHRYQPAADCVFTNDGEHNLVQLFVFPP
jgi:hypothetical protein